jgi:hypothetical protein
MADSIITTAPGSILEPQPAAEDPTKECLSSIRRAASRSDWKAAAWLLERHPLTRNQFSDAARDAAIRSCVLGAVVRGIQNWAEAERIPPEQLRVLLLHLQAVGLDPHTEQEAE